jgi:hypothetical protein
MKRVFFVFSLTGLLVAVTGFGQTKSNSTRLAMVPAPLRSASARPVPAHASPYNFPRVQYPRIEADSRVTFRFKAPDARKVQVAIAGVPFDMTREADGVWTYTSAPQPPATTTTG